MTIYYNVVDKHRNRFPVDYVCFGLLNKITQYSSGDCHDSSRFMPSNFREGTSTERRAYHNKAYTFFCENHTDMRAIELDFHDCLLNSYSRGSEQLERACANYIREAKEMIDLFPFMKEITTVHPRLRVVRVKTFGQPMDKVMFCLTVLRNLYKEVANKMSLGYYDGNTNNIYYVLDENLPDKKMQLIFIWVFEMYKYTNYSTVPAIQEFRVRPKFNTEYSVLNPSTFGKQSLLNLYNDGEVSWYQGTFEESERGYWRDNRFYEERIQFPGAVIPQGYSMYDGLSDDNQYGINYREVSYGGALYRKMFDCFSVEGDEPLIPNVVWTDLVGFVFTFDSIPEKIFSLQRIFNDFKSNFEA